MVSYKIRVAATYIALALTSTTIPISVSASGAGATKNKSSNSSPANASSSPKPSDAADQLGNQKGGGPSGGGNQGGGSGGEQLAGWLASVAAQNLGAHLASDQMIQSACKGDKGSCIFMTWQDFVSARAQGLVYKEEVDSLGDSLTQLRPEMRNFYKQFCHAPQGKPAPGANRQRGEYGETFGGTASAPTGSPWVPLEHLNAWLTAVGTAVTTVTGIFKAFQPTYNMGSIGQSGITSDDLVANIQAGLLAKSIAVNTTPVSDETNPDVAQKLVDVQNGLKKAESDVEFIRKHLADESSCKPPTAEQKKDIDAGLAKISDQISTDKAQIASIFSGFSKSPSSLGSFSQAVNLANFAYPTLSADKNKVLDNYVIDLQLSDSAGASGTKQHWWGTIDQLFQVTILAKYRLISVRGQLLEVGTDAVYCQTRAKIQDDATTLIGAIGAPAGASSTSTRDMKIYTDSPDAGTSPASGSPMCVDKEAIQHMRSESSESSATSTSLPSPVVVSRLSSTVADRSASTSDTTPSPATSASTPSTSASTHRPIHAIGFDH